MKKLLILILIALLLALCGFIAIQGVSLGSVKILGISEMQDKNADLEETNLKNANIKNTNFKNTELEYAIWVDGKVCGAGSIGSCW